MTSLYDVLSESRGTEIIRRSAPKSGSSVDPRRFEEFFYFLLALGVINRQQIALQAETIVSREQCLRGVILIVDLTSLADNDDAAWCMCRVWTARCDARRTS